MWNKQQTGATAIEVEFVKLIDRNRQKTNRLSNILVELELELLQLVTHQHH